MSTFPVSPEKESQLAERMHQLGISEDQLEETFVRSSGHGGQNVNKTSTCVQLLHRPTGTSVRCQDTRQQGLNRFRARHLLLDKIAAARKRERLAVQAERERARRRKRPRSQAAKRRILADKSRHKEKKQQRRRVSFSD